MKTGTICKISDRGYGFVRPDLCGRDVFFHAKSLQAPLEFDERLIGQQVDYDQGENPRDGRPCATAVFPAKG